MRAVATDRPAAVIFDLDGTLVDTVPARIAAWREAFAEAGIAVADERLEPMIGMDGRALARAVGSESGHTADDDWAETIDRLAGQRFDVHNRSPRPLPGVADAIRKLEDHAITWAIATSSRAEQVAASIAALALPHAPRIVDGSRVAHAKPAPDLLLLAADELGVDPARTWYVGDSTWDMRAATAAGMRPISVLAGAAVDEATLRSAGAEIVLATLHDLELPG